MSARTRRLEADYQQILQDFSNQKHIIITPLGDLPPEKYHVTYLVNGIYLKEDRTVETIKRHEVDIILHADYPRYKPVVKIHTPIFHPNFNDGQVCIGDIWGAGETLSDIIVNIGDMIQYQSWNSFSPLSADAAEWAIKNKFLFPVGEISLHPKMTTLEEPVENLEVKEEIFDNPRKENISFEENDYFEITSEELKGVTFVPSAERMQSMANSGYLVDGKKINIKTIVQKGLVWGVLGGIVGWGISELLDSATSTEKIIEFMGYTEYELYYQMDLDTAISVVQNAVRISSALFIGIVSSGIGAFMGYGEGNYYGSKESAKQYALRGFGISLGLGLVFGYLAQILYTNLLTDGASDITQAIARGIAWSAAGLGVGLAIGLIKPEKKRIVYTSIGGVVGGFIGGFIFNYISSAIVTSDSDTGVVSRLIGILVMGLLIGTGVGMLEQFAKSAWLKVIRGEFEGKEYLVFSGKTSIGNTGTNSIVLFKDKAVSEHHCEINQDGGKYVLSDLGSSQGTLVNGQNIQKHILRKGDAISVGNTVLIFNVKDGK